MQPCPFCELGELRSFVDSEDIKYNGKNLVVEGVQLSKCLVCGEEMSTPEQARINQRLFADARRSADGLMTSEEIRKWRNGLGWTQAQAVTFLGGGANAFSKYERGEVVQSRSMDLLMRLVAICPEARDALKRLVTGDWKGRVDVVPSVSFGGDDDMRWLDMHFESPAFHKTVARLGNMPVPANDDHYTWSTVKVNAI